MTGVDYQVHDRIATITLNRPQKLNALSPEMMNELFRIFKDVKENPDVWVGIVTGAGRAFSAGQDLIAKAGPAEQWGATSSDIYTLMSTIWKPLIAAINGHCLAQGAGIALCCDIRIASEQALVGWPQVKRGIVSMSGPCILFHLIPRNKALELLFTGEFLSAQDALALHLVNRVVPQDRLMEEAATLARSLLANAPVAMRAIKETAIRGLNMGLEDRARFCKLLAEKVAETHDAKEGLQAFAEKRPPVWEGR